MVVKMFGALGLFSGMIAVATFQLWWMLSRPRVEVEIGADFYDSSQSSGVVTDVYYPVVGSWLYLLLLATPLALGIAIGTALTRAGWTLTRER
ncbi:hypothetical protein [Nocardia brasiliensis]|uniref:hypothetical protein n=1 Tax=Nocardia brasiliensis TaxID=37326 RepID=UPI003D93D1FB